MLFLFEQLASSAKRRYAAPAVNQPPPPSTPEHLCIPLLRMLLNRILLGNIVSSVRCYVILIFLFPRFVRQLECRLDSQGCDPELKEWKASWAARMSLILLLLTIEDNPRNLARPIHMRRPIPCSTTPRELAMTSTHIPFSQYAIQILPV